MTIRLLASLAAVAIIAATVGVGAQKPTPKAWTPPRTPDGHVDLQGVWYSDSPTPLERPKALEAEVTDIGEAVERQKAESLDIESFLDQKIADSTGTFAEV